MFKLVQNPTLGMSVPAGALAAEPVAAEPKLERFFVKPKLDKQLLTPTAPIQNQPPLSHATLTLALLSTLMDGSMFPINVRSPAVEAGRNTFVNEATTPLWQTAYARILNHSWLVTLRVARFSTAMIGKLEAGALVPRLVAVVYALVM